MTVLFCCEAPVDYETFNHHWVEKLTAEFSFLVELLL